MYKKGEIEAANKTSRATKSVGKFALLPRLVRENEDKELTILDYGAGKEAIHTEMLRRYKFHNVTAWEFGDNFDSSIHDTEALTRQYDLVFASNVLNVQQSEKMLRATLEQVSSLLNLKGRFFCNFPKEPNHLGLFLDEVENILQEYFPKVERIKRKYSGRIWMCSNSTIPGIPYPINVMPMTPNGS